MAAYNRLCKLKGLWCRIEEPIQDSNPSIFGLEDVAIYDKQHDISMIMTKARAAINDVIREYILDTVPIPYPKLLITNIPSGTVFFQAKISISSKPNLESITKQLFKFRRKAGISPRAGIYCKGSNY